MLTGCDERFWQLNRDGSVPIKLPGDREVIINETLAAELNASIGDQVVLRLPSANQVPADSPFGRKEGRVNSLAGLTIIGIIPTQGLGRFSLHPSQQEPKNAFVSLKTIQNALGQPNGVNAILVAGNGRDPTDAVELLHATGSVRLWPTLALPFHATKRPSRLLVKPTK